MANRTVKFRPLLLLGNGIIVLLRPVTVPVEMFLRVDVGERYAALSGLGAFVLMGVWSRVAHDSGVIVLLMPPFVLRLAINKLLSIYKRRRGRPNRHTRRPGKPMLSLVLGKRSVRALIWLEPLFALLLAAALHKVSLAAAQYLDASALCLMAVNILRGWVSYHRRLDAIDSELEQRVRTPHASPGQSFVEDGAAWLSPEQPESPHRAQRLVVKRRGAVDGIIVVRPHQLAD